MTDSNNLPDNALAGAPQLSASDGGAAVDNTLSLDEINQFLGTTYKDKSTALASLKETKSYVGKKIDAANPAPAVDPTLVAKVSSLEEQVFYANNPQFKGHEAVIAAMANGKNPSEVVGMDAFKTYFEKAQVADEVSKTKSVVASNSRLGAQKSFHDDAILVANASGSSTSDVAAVAAKALTEALQGN